MDNGQSTHDHQPMTFFSYFGKKNANALFNINKW